MDFGNRAPPIDSPNRVLIIGGGLAGLAAASVLALRGLKVSLLESRPRLGGRASSFHDPGSGELIDNCQHVSMGCCTNLADFCRRVGIDGLLSQEKVLYFQDERGRVSRIGSSPLPAPLHLLPSFFRARFLGIPDKLRIAHGVFRLLREPRAPKGQSFRDWLFGHHQTTRTCERFWSVILTSASNESLENIDYRYARQVFVEGFLRSRASGVMEIPRVPLGEFYGKSLEDWFEGHNVELRLGTAATGLLFDGDTVRACRTRDNEEFFADFYILAVPFHRVADLLPAEVVNQHEELAGLSQLKSSPITSVHLWYDRPVMKLPHLVIIGRTVQWLFRRSNGSYVQAVISASHELSSLGKQKIFEHVSAEIQEILPKARSAQPKHHRVVIERQATYSILPGIDRFRPSQKTSIENLWLAGDYTQTGWPATMEGAVRSGYLAAEGILANLGIEEVVLQPPLKPGLLVGWLDKSSTK